MLVISVFPNDTPSDAKLTRASPPGAAREKPSVKVKKEKRKHFHESLERARWSPLKKGPNGA